MSGETHIGDAIGWDGGACPVDPSAIVQPRYRGSPEAAKGVRIEWPCPAWRLNWSHDGQDDDIVAYHVVDGPSQESPT